MGNFDRRRSFNSVFKMDITIWTSVLFAVITFGTPVSSDEPRVVCYYTNWSVYRPGTARFNPQNINPYLCTHLVYAFGGFTKENSLKPFDKYQDIEKGGYAKFTGLKTYNKNLKTLLAIGGWNEGSTRFSPMVASRERRKEFVRNAIKFLRQNRFDGLDLDWEYPAFRDGGKPKDKEHYAKLVKELREEFENESQKTGKPRLLLTMAVPAGIEYIQKGFDIKTLNKYLDWMNLLTYDYHSAFEPAVNHHAPLFPIEEPNEYSVDGELNIDYTIKFYLEHGAEPSKLVLGIPTYGRSYTLFNPDAVELGSPADGPGEQGDATREKGYLAYYEICEAIKKNQRKRSLSSDEESDEEEDEAVDQPWTVMYPNSKAMGPIAYRGNQWVGYDDEDIVRKKAEYVADNKLGGIMFWSIDNDDFRGTCHGKPYPLIEAAKESYYAKLGSSINSVAVTTQSAPVRSSNKRKNRPRITTTTTTTTTTRKPSTSSYNLRVSSTTPAWGINTPEPPTTPDPGSDFKCVDEGFFPHPRDCKKYFWCLDSGPSNLGIVAHQFTCPSGLYFNKAADSCDFARNVLCKKPAATTKAPTVAPSTTTTTAATTTTTRKAFLSTRNSVLFRTTSTSTTTSRPKIEEEDEELNDEDAEDPKVIKELIDLIKKVGGIEQLEKQLHLGEPSSSSISTDGVVTTTPASFNKKLYQKVLDRTRGQNKYTGNNLIEKLTQSVQNSRRGPQNEGLEPSKDRDKPLRKDRPQYVTINRQRGFTTTTAVPEDSDEDYSEEEEKVESTTKVQPLERRQNVAVTAKPLQYVNIRRGRPNIPSISDTADDSASRNALFERQESLSAISESVNVIDALTSRRESKPEYVTIRRQRPTTEETTTEQYHLSEEEEEERKPLPEKDLPTQPKYNIIVRSQTTASPDEPSTRSPIFKIYTLPTDSPSSSEPTSVLAVQISSLLNSLNSSNAEDPEIETEAPITEIAEPTTISTTASTTTTTTTRAPPSRRTTIARRRGSTIKTTPAPSSTTQVSPRNYTIVRRRRPLRGPNDITSDSDISNDLSRKIRSTTPDSREVNGVNETTFRRFRSRFQGTRYRNEDSVPAEASLVTSGQFRSNDDDEISLTPVEVEPKFVPRQRFNLRTERRFPRPSTLSGSNSDTVADSEVSAATVEARRPSVVTRGRSRFTLSSTTEATAQATSTSTLTARRPTFGRFTPRPFTRPPPSPAVVDEDVTLNAVTQRTTLRLAIARTRPTSLVVGRKLPFPSRQPTTQQTLVSPDNYEEDDEPETRVDDILLSESAREEKEHDEPEPNIEEEVPKRRIVIKKLRAPSSTPEGVVISTETIPIETDTSDTSKKRFRVIRRRPSSSTTTEIPVFSEPPTGPGLQRIRKVIRKKLRPTDTEQKTPVKTLGSLNAFKSSTTEVLEVFNYGEKTKAPLTTTSTEAETEPFIEEVTEFYKEEKKITDTTVAQKIEAVTQVTTQEAVTEKVMETIEEENVQTITEETITTANTSFEQSKDETLTSENKTKIVTEEESITEQPLHSETKAVNEDKDIVGGDSKEFNKSSETSETQTENKLEITIATEEKGLDILENKETDTQSLSTETNAPETTTTSTTISTTTSSRTRLPYRPRKKIFTPSTEPSVPSTSKTFSRKYNPGVYTSPATVDRPQFKPSGAVTRRPFSSKIFTRKPFTTKTTQKAEEEEYSDEIAEDEEHEQDNPFVFVPANQLFTRKPDSVEEDEAANSEELLEGGEGDENYEEEDEQELSKFPRTTRRPGYKPRVINSSTFRTSTTTTELPKRIATSQNRTGIITRFGSNKPVSDKKRVQNIPSGYNSPLNVVKPKGDSTPEDKTEFNTEDKTTTLSSVTDNETTTVDDDYLTATSAAVTDAKEATTSYDISTANAMGTETVTGQMEIDDSTDDYLEYTEGTTNYPTTQDITTQTQSDPEIKTTIVHNTKANTITNTEATEEPLSITTTTMSSPVSPVIKTQFNKLFSISRVVEVNSKLDKHRLNKNNETTLIEEGQIRVEKKPMVDKIGEVSRFSLIKIVEDDIPIYLTKLGHVYPVAHPPDNIIRIDEARNARALNENTNDAPKENLIASESINEGYRHIKEVTDSKDQERKSHILHVPNDQFLSYINDDNKNNKDSGDSLFDQWQFVPAAYENEKIKAAKNFEIITPRTMFTNPSTLPLEGLFKTDNPMTVQKANDGKSNPFVFYSASNDIKVDNIPVSRPDHVPTIITFAKGQELNRVPIEQTSVKEPINGPIYQGNYISSTFAPLTTLSNISPTIMTTVNTVMDKALSPILDLLSTTASAGDVTPTTTEVPSTTETLVEETKTTTVSPLDAKRGKFPFPRRPIIITNFTRPSITPRTAKKINTTVISNQAQKINKRTFNPLKSRFSANRSQNVPVDLIRKNSKTAPKTFGTTKVYTTEAPRTTTERKLYVKPIRPSFRPSFLPRKTTPIATTGDT